MRSVAQDSFERQPLVRVERTFGLDEMPEHGRDAGDGVVWAGCRKRGDELGNAKWGKCVAPAQREEVRHGRHEGSKT